MIRLWTCRLTQITSLGYFFHSLHQTIKFLIGNHKGAIIFNTCMVPVARVTLYSSKHNEVGRGATAHI